MKKIGIIGTRDKNKAEDFKKVQDKFLELYEDGDWIVSGGAKDGGDAFAERLSIKHQVPILIYRAKWKKYGKPAGLIRNPDIAEWSDVLIAIQDPERTKDRGTEDTIKHFLKDNDESKLYQIT